MMRRTMQANDIRTNISFEFAVVGETGVRTITSDVLDLMDKYQEQGILVRLVGINLKKPTANPVFLTKHAFDVIVDAEKTTEDEVTPQNKNEVVSEEDTMMEEDSND